VICAIRVVIRVIRAICVYRQARIRDPRPDSCDPRNLQSV
jgi:hypothetical protein